jgi:hypothetical protein
MIPVPMEPESVDNLPRSPSSSTWLTYYADASKRRRARGWHRRSDFSPGERRRNRKAVAVAVLLAASVVAITLSLLLPR